VARFARSLAENNSPQETQKPVVGERARGIVRKGNISKGIILLPRPPPRRFHLRWGGI